MSYEAMNDKTHPFKINGDYKTIFIGHTPTTYWNEKEEIRNGIIVQKGNPITTPIRAANIWNIDTGAAYGGNLTIMNIDTEEYFQFK